MRGSLLVERGIVRGAASLRAAAPGRSAADDSVNRPHTGPVIEPKYVEVAGMGTAKVEILSSLVMRFSCFSPGASWFAHIRDNGISEMINATIMNYR